MKDLSSLKNNINNNNGGENRNTIKLNNNTNNNEQFNNIRQSESQRIELESNLNATNINDVNINTLKDLAKQNTTTSNNNNKSDDINSQSRDPVSGLRTPLEFGRPMWDKIFKEYAYKFKGESIAIMFCGPKPVAKQLDKYCHKHSTNDTKFLLYKEFF